MDLALTQTIGVKKYAEGATDAHGNNVGGWSQPIYVGVYSIAPTASNEPYEAGREAVITGLTVLAPSGTKVSRLDRVIVAGEEYTVEGEIANWDMGPFGFTPGISFNLKRVEG